MIIMISASRTVIRLLKGIESICLERNSSAEDGKSLDRTAGFVGYATAPHILSSDAPVLSSELRPKRWRARVESETEGLDWRKPIEDYVETWLESTEMERMVRYLATKRSESGLRMASPFC
ncbi:hypothetical protein HID58_080370 [Brassica napus]|uniref:Uncharacterized protein n=2 Tax=Brassica napus TaxID=3708 RepID=A0ABQ7Y619_BRANA|nr:hypothetical protein HID58_080370 [Brassica napus]